MAMLNIQMVYVNGACKLINQLILFSAADIFPEALQTVLALYQL